MYKVVKSFLFVSLVLCAFGITATYAAEKYGYVDISKAFDSYQKTKDYDSSLEKIQQDKEKERDQKESEIKKLEDKTKLLNDATKSEKEKDLEQKRQDLYEFMQKASIDLRKERDEKIKEILLDIQNVIEDYAKKNKFTIIFNDRVLLYAEKTMDVTDDIINLLNSKYKTKK